MLWPLSTWAKERKTMGIEMLVTISAILVMLIIAALWSNHEVRKAERAHYEQDAELAKTRRPARARLYLLFVAGLWLGHQTFKADPKRD
jgi:ABC-type Fe3+ transport system permease subunit